MSFLILIEERVDLEVQESKIELMTAKDIMQILSCGKNKVYAIINQKDFPKIKIGGRYYIPKTEFTNWINNNLYKKYTL